MRESKIKGKRYVYDKKSGKMVEIPSGQQTADFVRFIESFKPIDEPKGETNEPRDAPENREAAD